MGLVGNDEYHHCRHHNRLLNDEDEEEEYEEEEEEEEEEYDNDDDDDHCDRNYGNNGNHEVDARPGRHHLRLWSARVIFSAPHRPLLVSSRRAQFEPCLPSFT